MPTLELRNLSVDLIDENPDQVRKEYDMQALTELADSIAKVGLIQPVSVLITGERFKLIQGSRRLRAHKLLRRQFIQANIIQNENGEALAIMLHENLFRDDLTPLEEGQFYKRLLDIEKLTLPQLIQYTNKSESYVRARFELCLTSPDIQQAVHLRQIPVSHALELAKIDNTETRSQYLAYAISTGASLATVKYWRQGFEANKSIPPTTDTLPLKIERPLQSPAFGWYCAFCALFHEAPDMQTLHLCKPCYGAVRAEIQNPKQGPNA
jgi:ParB family chromosome partitioning protein